MVGKAMPRSTSSVFVDKLRVHSGDRNVSLKEFSISLTDRAYSWYAILPPSSLASWEDLAKKFHSKFFYVDSEDLLTYVGRFRELAVDMQDLVAEDHLVKLLGALLGSHLAHLVTNHRHGGHPPFEGHKHTQPLVPPTGIGMTEANAQGLRSPLPSW
ncbi:hypothetical protein Acr_17g0000690 [Actinidia rufa]|uniref:Retrotransposon gag domain-containing protein n=1 Tax=Actinidia rufa TaxID=165716 RepID=A0A7J0G0X7_9ERIC|nr:hypothetical protein Acr_17g0000690 [Actinidia rufa]